MQPSSVVFVVVVGVWAAFLVQGWVARRDHLVTARTADRFSEAMRVLDLRPARPTDKPSHAGRIEAHTRAEAPAVDQPVGSEPATVGRDIAPARRSNAALDPAGNRRGRSSSRSRRSGRGERRPRVGRFLRGVVLLSVLAAVPATAWLAVTGVLAPAAPGAAGAALVLVLLWARHGVVARRRRARAEARRRPSAPALNREADSLPAPDSEVATPVGSGGLPETTPTAIEVTVAEVEATEAAAAEVTVYDLNAVEVSEAEARAAAAADAAAVASAAEPRPKPSAWPELDEDDMPISWDPVPVPRPTYTMKARAYRPAQPAIPDGSGGGMGGRGAVRSEREAGTQTAYPLPRRWAAGG